MDTGPREGDLYFENDFEPGTPDYYATQRNNAIYKERHRQKNNDGEGFPSWLIYALCFKNMGKPLDSMLKQF